MSEIRLTTDSVLIVSIIAVLMSVINFIFTLITSAKDDVRDLEHRLTSLELKVEPLWDAVRNEIPKLLIKEETPTLDKFLRMTSNEIDEMTDQQIHDLTCLLDEEITKARESGDIAIAIGIVLIRATLKERHE